MGKMRTEGLSTSVRTLQSKVLVYVLFWTMSWNVVFFAKNKWHGYFVYSTQLSWVFLITCCLSSVCLHFCKLFTLSSSYLSWTSGPNLHTLNTKNFDLPRKNYSTMEKLWYYGYNYGAMDKTKVLWTKRWYYTENYGPSIYERKKHGILPNTRKL